MAAVTEAAEAVVVFTEAAVVASMAAAVLSAATTGVGITAALAAMADEEVTTEVAARTEACAEVRQRGGIPARIGAGPGRAEVLLGTLRRAGIRLQDQATARAWPATGA
jgi:hypothetical protein